MPIAQMNWKPADRQLRQFGYLCAVMFPLLTWLFSGRPTPSVWTDGNTRWIAGAACLGFAFAMLGQIKPSLLKPVFVGLSLAALPIGMVVGEVLFFLIYVLVFCPMALLFRLVGRDSLDRKLEPAAASYWRPKVQPANVKRYFRQF